MTTRTTSPETIFHPVEHAILSDWLKRPRPACARGIYLGDYWDDPDAGDETNVNRAPPRGGHVQLRAPACGLGCGQFDERDNAVARICLEAIQGHMPQWSAMKSDGKFVVGRRYDAVLERPVTLLPKHLLEINWATSGPGYSWPEAYYVTFLPVYDVFVVTASQDSPELHGYVDEALGWFHNGADIREAAEGFIKGHWSTQHNNHGQERWECVFSSGLISEEQARQWADEVWGPEEHEWEDDEEDLDDETSPELERRT